MVVLKVETKQGKSKFHEQVVILNGQDLPHLEVIKGVLPSYADPKVKHVYKLDETTFLVETVRHGAYTLTYTKEVKQ